MIHGTIAEGIDWGVGSQFALLDWEQFSRHQHHFHCKSSYWGTTAFETFSFLYFEVTFWNRHDRDLPHITQKHGSLKLFLSFFFVSNIIFGIFSLFLFCDNFLGRVAIWSRHIRLAKLKLSTDCEPDSFNFSICSAAPSQSFLSSFLFNFLFISFFNSSAVLFLKLVMVTIAIVNCIFILFQYQCLLHIWRK